MRKPVRWTLSLWMLGATIWLLAGSFFPASARADDFYLIIQQKQQEKAHDRWSLSDWLQTRDRMRLMDLWLALHSPSPYEFYVSGAYSWPSNTAYSNGWNAQVAAYASIFGLEFQSEHLSDQRWLGLFHLRIFGLHDQATNITLETGVRDEEYTSPTYGSSPFRSALLGVHSTLYLAKSFGVDGLFRYYFDSTPATAPVVYSGTRWEGNAFIDFNFIRVFGGYFSSPEILNDTLGTNMGFQLGGRIYF